MRIRSFSVMKNSYIQIQTGNNYLLESSQLGSIICRHSSLDSLGYLWTRLYKRIYSEWSTVTLIISHEYNLPFTLDLEFRFSIEIKIKEIIGKLFFRFICYQHIYRFYTNANAEQTSIVKKYVKQFPLPLSKTKSSYD